MPGRPTQLSRGPYHWPLKRPPVGSASRMRSHSCVECLGLAKRHGEARIHQLHAERQRHVLEARDDRRDALPARQVARRKLAQRLGLGIDGDDAPAAAQHLDDVAAVAAAEIDGERVGRRRRRTRRARRAASARRSVAQLAGSRRPSRRIVFRHALACRPRLSLRSCDRIAPTIIRSLPGGTDEEVGTPCRGRCACSWPGGGARRHEGARGGRQEGRRAHLVRRRTTRRKAPRSWAPSFTKMYGIKVNVVRTTAQVAYQRADAGHQEQPDRSATSSRRPTSATTCGSRPKGSSRSTCRRTAAKIAEAFQQPRSRRLLPHHVGRPRRDHLQHLQGEGRRTRPRSGPTCSIPSGRARSRPAIPAFSGYVGTWVLIDEASSTAGTTSRSWRRTSRRSAARSTTR